MNFIVLSRLNIHKFTYDKPYIIISITEPNDFFPQILDNYFLKGLLQIKFADSDKDVVLNNKTVLKTITRDDAKIILKFVDKYKDVVDLIVCQCDGGIARSSAVAAALGKILINDDTFVFNNKKYRPNMLVYRTILNEYYRVN
jgi:predicted protein tyrosine phosphatase